jgi:hypothetical protein
LAYAINGKGRGDASEVVGAESVAHEVALDNVIHDSTDDDCIRRGEVCKSRCNTGGFTECELFMPTPAAYFPYDNGSGMDANADGKLDRLFSLQTRVQLFHRRDNAETCPHCPLHIVFKGPRIAKVDEDTIVTILGNVPSKLLRHLGTVPMVGLHHHMEVFGIELSCEAGGIHKRTAQDRDLPAFSPR